MNHEHKLIFFILHIHYSVMSYCMRYMKEEKSSSQVSQKSHGGVCMCVFLLYYLAVSRLNM